MNEDSKKCNKYESFFTFKSDEDFLNHIKTCEDCAKEHEKYMKISSLLKETADIYFEQEKKNKMMNSVKRLACCFLVFIGLSLFTGFKVYDNYIYQVSIEQDSSISEMGLPIDKYGFLSL